MRNWRQAMPTAEAYWLDRVLYDTQHKPAEMARFRADPKAYLTGLPVDDAAQKALYDNDIAFLYRAGVNPYLLRAHCLGLGVPEADYLGALRRAGEDANG